MAGLYNLVSRNEQLSQEKKAPHRVVALPFILVQVLALPSPPLDMSFGGLPIIFTSLHSMFNATLYLRPRIYLFIYYFNKFSVKNSSIFTLFWMHTWLMAIVGAPTSDFGFWDNFQFLVGLRDRPDRMPLWN